MIDLGLVGVCSSRYLCVFQNVRTSAHVPVAHFATSGNFTYTSLSISDLALVGVSSWWMNTVSSICGILTDHLLCLYGLGLVGVSSWWMNTVSLICGILTDHLLCLYAIMTHEIPWLGVPKEAWLTAQVVTRELVRHEMPTISRHSTNDIIANPR